MLSKINNLLNYCYEDSIVDKIAGLEFQLFLLSTKSLIPFENKIGCKFDENRYKSEMEVFRYYINGNDDIINYYFQNSNNSSMKDNLLEYKILPIVITNTDWETLIEEVFKLVKFYSINNITILNSLLLSSIIYEYFYSDIIDIESIENKTNDRLIEFSLKEFCEDKFHFQLDKKNLIDFEKERIKAISRKNYFNEDNLKRYKALQHIRDNIISTKQVDKENEVVINNFASYIFKLRSGTVNPEKLIITKTPSIDFKEYLKRSSFVHPLLGKCIVIQKNSQQIILKNKLGFLRVNI